MFMSFSTVLYSSDSWPGIQINDNDWDIQRSVCTQLGIRKYINDFTFTQAYVFNLSDSQCMQYKYAANWSPLTVLKIIFMSKIFQNLLNYTGTIFVLFQWSLCSLLKENSNQIIPRK